MYRLRLHPDFRSLHARDDHLGELRQECVGAREAVGRHPAADARARLQGAPVRRRRGRRGQALPLLVQGRRGGVVFVAIKVELGVPLVRAEMPHRGRHRQGGVLVRAHGAADEPEGRALRHGGDVPRDISAECRPHEPVRRGAVRRSVLRPDQQHYEGADSAQPHEVYTPLLQRRQLAGSMGRALWGKLVGHRARLRVPLSDQACAQSLRAWPAVHQSHLIPGVRPLLSLRSRRLGC
mmetsp:Transcript_10134/g.30093  ORF Transcript_10134/g.30093 Transcript_10134/m.30093 type:complete len:237 (-) Transcript_10134:1528-2238(-)